ncbi:MAG: rhomboid family intramembrane serine protease [Herbinix sp.]|nr:rhomboid family intramembrane serine protease [Herbinix sp.]
MKRLLKMKGTQIIILLWFILYLLSIGTNIVFFLGGKGFDLIDGEYYRIITVSLLHNKFWHLSVNCLALFWIGYYLESHIGSGKYVLFAIVSCTISEAIFLSIYRNTDRSVGGSSMTFSLIGLIIILLYLKPSFPRFKLGTWYGNWILIYAIAGNLPVIPAITISTIVLHGISLIIGVLLGTILIKTDLL